MKILVLGAGGMAGHVIALRLKERGYDVTGLARRKLDFCKSIVADVTREESLEKILFQGKYAAVVNAVGVLHAANFKPAYGIRINSYFPHYLAELFENKETKVIHLSTDCVFNGHEGGGYKEDHLPTATDYYGRSKALGELQDEKNLVFRMSIVGPDINEAGEGLFHWFMRQQTGVRGFAQVKWTGVSTVVLADAIEAAIRQDITGTYQLVNNEVISKYNLLRLFNELRKNPIVIARTDDFETDKSLKNTRTDFDFKVPSYEKMVEDMGEWIRTHKELYPWYNLKECL